MNNVSIALRAQDFHEGLRHIGAFGPKEANYSNTLLIGKAASLAMHLRGLIYIKDIKQLMYAASALGIGQELPLVLQELEEVDFVSIVKNGSKIKRIDIRIPEFHDGYTELGARWKLLEPTELEEVSLAALNRLYQGPIPQRNLLSEFKTSKTEEGVLLDIMKSGQLLCIQPIDGEPTAYTPLAVDGNPTKYLEWASKFPGDVPTILEKLKDSQGMSIDDPAISKCQALVEAISTGVLMPVQVQGTTGVRHFIFAPRGGLSQEQRVILDKARAIVSCVRYGQSFAASRKIFSPTRVLEKLRDDKTFKRGHPDLFDQYGLLVEKLIGHPIEEPNGLWNFQIDDTAENMKAITVAIEMIKHGDSPSVGLEVDAEKELMSPTGYLGPISARPKLLAQVSPSKETRTEIVRQMTKLLRGVSS